MSELNCCEEKNVTRPEAIANIVQSIACEENAIASVICAESKKIKKAIEIAQSVDDLVKVNTSVKETLVSLVNLEMILVSKLEEVSKFRRTK